MANHKKHGKQLRRKSRRMVGGSGLATIGGATGWAPSVFGGIGQQHAVSSVDNTIAMAPGYCGGASKKRRSLKKRRSSKRTLSRRSRSLFSRRTTRSNKPLSFASLFGRK